jgi:hypothetical protein
MFKSLLSHVKGSVTQSRFFLFTTVSSAPGFMTIPSVTNEIWYRSTHVFAFQWKRNTIQNGTQKLKIEQQEPYKKQAFTSEEYTNVAVVLLLLSHEWLNEEIFISTNWTYPYSCITPQHFIGMPVSSQQMELSYICVLGFRKFCMTLIKHYLCHICIRICSVCWNYLIISYKSEKDRQYNDPMKEEQNTKRYTETKDWATGTLQKTSVYFGRIHQWCPSCYPC